MMENARASMSETTGLPSEPMAPVAGEGPLVMGWISEDWVETTRDVWGRHLGREVSRDEAIEMLVMVRHLEEVLSSAEQRRKTK